MLRARCCRLRVRPRSAARVARRLRPGVRAHACRRALQAPRRLDGRADRVDARRPPRSRAAAVPRAADDAAQASTAPAATDSGSTGRRPRRRAAVAGGRGRPSPTSPAPSRTIPTPPWRCRGCRCSTPATTSAGCSTPSRRCSPAPSWARRGGVDRRLMKATITESFAGVTVEALFDQIATLDRYPRVDAPGASGHADAARHRRAGVVGGAARPGRAVHSVQAAAHGPHRVRRQRRDVMFERVQARRTRPRRVDPPRRGRCGRSTAPS